MTVDPASQDFVLNDSALIGVDHGGKLIGWLGLSNEKVILTTGQLTALAHALADGSPPNPMAGHDEQVAALAQLADAGLLRPASDVACRMPDYWTSPEALVHLRASLGWPRPASEQAALDGDTDPGAATGGRPGEIRLARSRRRGRRTAAMLRRRRSSSSVCAPVALADLAALLQACCDGLEDPAEPGRIHRPYPTAGGSDELRVLVIAAAVRDLRRGVYRYDPGRSALGPVPDPAGTEFADHNTDRARAYLGLASDLTPAVILVIDAIWPRLLRRYTDAGMISAYCDAGGLLQTLYLVTADLGLSGTAVASLSAVRNAEILGLDPLHESQVACYALGGGTTGRTALTMRRRHARGNASRRQADEATTGE